MPLTYELRPAVAEDVGVTYEVTREAMKPYVEATWGKWEEHEQVVKHRQNFQPETHRLVLVGPEVAGLVAVEEEADYLWLVKLYLRVAYRSQGLGTALLRQVIQEAEDMRKPTRLRVLKANPRAKALYLRHGFQVVGQEAERYFLVRPQSGACARSS